MSHFEVFLRYSEGRSDRGTSMELQGQISTKTSISRDMGSATKAALILNRSVVQFRSLGRPTDISKSYFNVNV